MRHEKTGRDPRTRAVDRWNLPISEKIIDVLAVGRFSRRPRIENILRIPP